MAGVADAGALDALLAAMAGFDQATAEGEAEALALDLFGLRCKALRLTGERDENFRLRDSASGAEYVLKLAHPEEEPAALALVDEALLFLAGTACACFCPRLIPPLSGDPAPHVRDAAGRRRRVRLVSWIDGIPIRLAPRSAAQRAACGRLSADMAKALCGFDSPGARRAMLWDLARFDMVAPLLERLPDMPEIGFVREFVQDYGERVAPQFPRFRRQIVHNDFNGGNVIVLADRPDRVSGIIDFGDMIETALVADVAIAASAQIAAAESAASDIGEFLAAYQDVTPLAARELAAFPWLVAARLVQKVVIQTWHRRNVADSHHAGTDEAYVSNLLAQARQAILLKAQEIAR